MEEITEGLHARTARAPAEPVGLGVWQAKLLPLMVGMLVVLTAFFCVSNIIQMYVINSHIQQSDELDLEPALAVLTADDKTEPAMRLEYARLKTNTLLEGHAIKQRYHQASVIMMSRVYITYLGFITGMVLAMVGATFILGKLRESQSQMGAESPGIKVSLTTTSPGLLLALMGTVLMLSTIWARSEVKVTDRSLYVPTSEQSQADEWGDAPAPGPTTSFKDIGRGIKEELDKIEKREGGTQKAGAPPDESHGGGNDNAAKK